MIRPIELYIGLRYTRAKRRNHFISFISFISILGIFLAVTVLITVLSVMNGFGEELRDRILGVVSHVTISEDRGRLSDWRELMQRIDDNEHVQGAAPYIVGQGMLTRGSSVNGVLVRGILPELEPKVSLLKNSLIDGDLSALQAGKFHIVLGAELAWKLRVNVGSKVTLVIPQTLVTPAGVLPRFKRFTVAGIFDVDMHEYDSGLALIHMQDAASLYRMGKDVTGLRLKLNNLFIAPRVAENLDDILGPPYRASDWTRQHANFFRALKIEKRVMLIILVLIIAVAAFNIVSTLVMVVTDKQSDIAILRTLGLSPASIMGVFMVQGSVTGIFGTLLGAVGGIALATNIEAIVHTIEKIFNTTFLAADVYYITDLPGKIYLNDILIITGVSFVMCMLATLYPAWRAARVQPAEALRYE